MPLLILYQKSNGQLVSAQRANKNHSASNFPPKIQRLLDNAEELQLAHLLIDDNLDPATHEVRQSSTGLEVVRKDEANPRWLEPLMSFVGDLPELKRRQTRTSDLQVQYVVPAAANPEYILLQPGITVFVPVQARWHCAAELFDSIAKMELPNCEVDLILYDNSNDASFGNLCRWFLAGLKKFTSSQHIVDTTVTAADRQSTVKAVARIYGRMAHIVDREFVLTLEDDVIMQDRSILKKLYEILEQDEEAAAAAANTIERIDNKTMCWHMKGKGPTIQYAMKEDFIQHVDGVSFSCTLWRTRPLKMVALRPRRDNSRSFYATDIVLCADLKDKGYHCLMVWNLHCAHVEPYVSFIPLREEPLFERRPRKPSTRKEVSRLVAGLLGLPQPEKRSILDSVVSLFTLPQKLKFDHLLVVNVDQDIPVQFFNNFRQTSIPNNCTVVIFGVLDPVTWKQFPHVQFIDDWEVLSTLLSLAKRVTWWDATTLLHPEDLLQMMTGSGVIYPKLPSADVSLDTPQVPRVWSCEQRHLPSTLTSKEATIQHIFSFKAVEMEVRGSQWIASSQSWQPEDGWKPQEQIEGSKEPITYFGTLLDEGNKEYPLDVSIGMTCINHPEMTIDAIESLLETTKHLNREIMVWDNASIVDMSPLLKKYADHPHVQIIQSPENRGYIYPMNFMAKKSKGKYYVVANNDIIAHPGWFEALSEPFKDPRVAQTGPVPEYGHLNAGMLGGPGEGPPDYLEGYFFMVSRFILNRYPVFDEDNLIFATCEDADLSLRLQEYGYRIVAVPEARIDHLRSVTRKSDQEINIQMANTEAVNKAYMVKRWGSYIEHHAFDRHTILVRRKGANGDLLTCEPALKGLRWKFPYSRIVLVTACVDIMKLCPWVDDVRFEPEIGVKYSIEIDLDNSYENDLQQNRTRIVCSQMKVPVSLPGYWVTDAARKAIEAEFSDVDIPICVIHHHASWDNRRWGIKNWRDFARRMEGVGFQVIEVGAKEDERLNFGHPFYGRSWEELAALISKATICVCSDSSVLHIAVGLNKPTVAIFGPTIPKFVSESPVLYPVQVQGLACLGCHHQPPFPKIFSSCHQPALYCQQGLRPCVLFRKVMEVMRMNKDCSEALQDARV